MDIIDIDTVRLPSLKRPVHSSRSGIGRTVLSWLSTWEIYPILLLATFLRVYQFSTTEFDADQAAIYALARHAVVHGLLPVTTNIASIRILNPPATVYLLMLGAIFSANPYAGVIVTGVLNVLAVLFTYFVVRRYYGRFAGTIAGLFYAGAQMAVFYSGFLWNQNFLAPFVPLFLFTLFWGVIERRRGWLVPAVVLWGWMIQLHGSAVLLAIPLIFACVLAFKTLRWRDIFLSAGLLVLIYSPYIVWEFTSHFADVSILLQSLGGHAVIDKQAFDAYLDFLSPYPSGTPTLLPWQSQILGSMKWVKRGIEFLVVCASGLALLAVGQSRWDLLRFAPRGKRLTPALTGQATTLWEQLRAWWSTLLATPQRCGLLVLLAWQIIPIIYLSRHVLPIYDYYLLVLMPGPFILLGIFAAQVNTWLRSLKFPWPLTRIALSLLLIGLALALSVGSFIPNFARSGDPSYGYYTLHDMQNAIEKSDELANIYHAKHVYIAVDNLTGDSLTYLAEQMHTAHTTYASSNCLPLPGVSQGPALMLFGPADATAETLLKQTTNARLVSAPARVDGPPFHIYLVQPLASPTGATSFLNALAPDAGPAQFESDSAQVVIRWTALHSAAPADSTSYTYQLNARFSGLNSENTTAGVSCSVSNLQPGEQLLTAFSLPTGTTSAPAQISLTGSTWTTTPYDPTAGPLHLETFLTQSSAGAPLRTSDGTPEITLQG